MCQDITVIKAFWPQSCPFLAFKPEIHVSFNESDFKNAKFNSV